MLTLKKVTIAPPPRFQSLRNEIENARNVKTVSMGRLRDATGKDRLGKHVITEIEKGLKRAGLRSKQALTLDQNDLVRLYVTGTSVARIIEASHKCDEAADALLRDAAAGESSLSREKLDRIRDILDEE